jgi:hypothetical protein
MRYSTDHKQATRQRILEAAGRRFKKNKMALTAPVWPP